MATLLIIGFVLAIFAIEIAVGILIGDVDVRTIRGGTP